MRPCLTEEDDAVEFDRPWNPTNLLLLTFFGGLPAGGVLFALNERRLGRPEHFTRTLVVMIGASLVVYGVLAYLRVAGIFTAGEGDVKSVSRLVVRGISVGVAMIFSWQQSKRFRLAEMHDVEMGKHLAPVLLALVLGVVAVMIIMYGFTLLFIALGLQVEG